MSGDAQEAADVQQDPQAWCAHLEMWVREVCRYRTSHGWAGNVIETIFAWTCMSCKLYIIQIAWIMNTASLSLTTLHQAGD